jgi:hypothetical protein
MLVKRQGQEGVFGIKQSAECNRSIVVNEALTVIAHGLNDDGDFSSLALL